MDPPPRPSASLFEVYLRLRPATVPDADRFLDVEESEHGLPAYITIKPPATDHRKRAVERFAFTRVFEEDAAQLDIFKGTGVLPLIEGVVGTEGREGRDGLLATLGVTGSGKSHTILGSRSQRGLTQMALDLLFQSIGNHLVHPTCTASVFPSLSASDVSEAQMFPASVFLDTLYGDGQSERGYSSRAQTPMVVGSALSPQLNPLHPSSVGLYPSLSTGKHIYTRTNGGDPFFRERDPISATNTSSIRPVAAGFTRITRSIAKLKPSHEKDGGSFLGMPAPKRIIPCPSTLPQYPSVRDIDALVDQSAEYAIVVSMYEVYNDRIFDLLTGSVTMSKGAIQKRRALLFKSTEMSPDRKVVAGLRKVVCANLEEALMVLETGLMERKVAGTGSNAVSSRSHGFFCVEVKKRNRVAKGLWSSSTLTIVDLAGSERARNAKTAGATLAEAGKINESLMYLGQCMQMQSDNHDGNKNIVPFRQCKLTELLFSNSFLSSFSTSHQHHQAYSHRNPQKAIMIVTADPSGDFNATSQILRYSALAREVTVPRIPSVTSTILSSTTAVSGRNHPNSSNPIPSATVEELEFASAEVARLTSELEVLTLQLAEETARRRAAETSWKATEERMQILEQEIRDECYEEMESRIEAERRRWKGAWEEEADRNDEHLDRKIEILARGIDIYEDPEPTADERVGQLEDENEALRRKIENLERQAQMKSPTKKQRVLKAKKWEVDVGFESP